MFWHWGQENWIIHYALLVHDALEKSESVQPTQEERALRTIVNLPKVLKLREAV